MIPVSELTWLPADVLKGAGITPRRKRVFATATQQRNEREVGYAILSAKGYETNDEVVFAEPGDLTLLDVTTLEGFGVVVDNNRSSVCCHNHLGGAGQSGAFVL
ncbi:MAG: hypothetical protein DME26_19590 [Verrucomicrobia bacterium]|nr:MAG: hypothetical protein DME26_19590 [Verrucomicrobiota bacterium]